MQNLYQFSDYEAGTRRFSRWFLLSFFPFNPEFL